MALPQIVYNGKTINFPWGPYAFNPEYPHRRMQNFSATEIGEVINVTPSVLISMAFRNFENTAYPDLRRAIEQLWEWASCGQAWRFAMDSSLVSLTTLNGAASAAASSVVVTSNTGLTIGDAVIIRDSNHMQRTKISNIAGTTITLADTLDFAYVSGARFRHERYWPARLLDTKKHFIREMPPLMYDLEFAFMEDMNS